MLLDITVTKKKNKNVKRELKKLRSPFPSSLSGFSRLSKRCNLGCTKIELFLRTKTIFSPLLRESAVGSGFLKVKSRLLVLPDDARNQN